VPERGDPQGTEVVVGEREQNLAVDVVGAERGRVTLEPEAREPGLDVQDGSSAGSTRSFSA
jgi:hypothetical protein